MFKVENLWRNNDCAHFYGSLLDVFTSSVLFALLCHFYLPRRAYLCMFVIMHLDETRFKVYRCILQACLVLIAPTLLRIDKPFRFKKYLLV